MAQVDSDMTIGVCLVQSASVLNDTSDSARLDAEVLLAHVMGKTRTYFYTWPEKHISALDYAQFQILLKRRQNGEPIAYIVGEKEFWSHSFLVNPSTLIPRGDTELLVELILPLLDKLLEGESCRLKNTPPKVLDLGTGTGALAISIAKEYTDQVTVQGVDVSANAVALAQQNKTRLCADNCQFYVSDWFDAVHDVFEIIVSNPPYIDEHDPHLMQGDVRFEPLSALTAHHEGLSDIEAIVEAAPRFISSTGGTLLIEHGWEQGKSVRHIFARYGFVGVKTAQDLNGNDRVTLGAFRKKKGGMRVNVDTSLARPVSIS